MQSLGSLIGVCICLVSLKGVTAQETPSPLAEQTSPSTSSPSQAELMQLVYNETSCGSGLAGGYWPVEDLNTSALKSYSALALAKYVNENSGDVLATCQPNISGAKNSIRVDAACQQVVAGTNYIIAFHVMFPCRAPGTLNIPRELLANVFVPLPSTSDNAEPQVTSVVAIEED